jgi:HEAT repeat protein
VAEALVSRLTDKNGPVRVSAEQALAESVDPATTAALINSLDTTRWHMRLRAVEILVRRRDPGSTAALAGCLRDRDQEVRIAAVEAFAQRDDPAAAPGLVTCLVDVDDKVRRAAVKTLTSRESSQDLLAIAAKAGRISRSPAQEFVDAAEELMNRYYRRIAPSERPAVRAAMAQLTAALTDKRAN